jgi:hypothetical protein
MAVTLQTGKQTRVLIFGVTRKIRRRAFGYFQIARARRPATIKNELNYQLQLNTIT